MYRLIWGASERRSICCYWMWSGSRSCLSTGFVSILFFFFSSRRRHTRYIGDWSSDVCSSDLGAGVIVFVRDGRIHLYDPNNNQTQVLDVRVTPDTSELKSRTVNAARTIESASLSSNGDRIVFGTRGEALLFDPQTGDSKNLSQTPGVAERYPALSPDGQSLAYFSDESGEYQLHVRPLGNDGPVKKIPVEER